MKTKLQFILIVLTALAALESLAATKTWDGSSSGNWATAANWNAGTLPAAGDDLVFPLSVTRTNMTNNFSPNRAFNSVTFLGTNYTINGSTLIVTNGIRSGTPAGDNAHRIPNTIAADVQLGGSQTFIVSNLFTRLDILGDIDLGSHTLTIDGNGDHNYSGVISGTGGIEKLGGTWATLSGDNTFSGPVNIRRGVLEADTGLTSITPLGSTNGVTTVFDLGSLHIGGDFTNETLVLSGGFLFNNCAGCRWHGPINVVSNSSIDSAEWTIEGVLSGSGDLSLTIQSALFPPSNTGVTLAGNGNNTLSGTLQVKQGSQILLHGLLVLDKPSPFIAISGPLIIGEGGGGNPTNVIVRYAGDSQIGLNAITILSDGTLDLDGNSDAIGGPTLIGGTVTNRGSGLLTINGNIKAAYDTRAARIYGNTSLGNFIRTFTVTNSASTTGTELDVYGSISAGGIVKAGDGYMGLRSANSYDGLTTVSDGSLLVQDDLGLGSTINGTVVNSGATLYIASSTITEPLTLNGDGDTIEDRTGALRGLLATCAGAITVATDSSINVPSASPFNLTLSGTVSGTGNISKTGPGTLIYSGSDNNVYTGDTLVNSGVLLLNKTSAYAISNSASLIIGDSSDGTADDIVRYNSGNQLRTTVNIFINRTGVLDLNGFTDDVGDISMVGGTIDSGTGELQLRGTLTAIGTTSGLTFYPAVILGNLDLGSASRTVVVNNNSFLSGIPEDLVIGAAISGTANWTKTGPGEMFLGTSNSFSGTLTMNDGRLIVTNAFALGDTSNGVILNNGANLELRSGVTIAAEPLTLSTTNTAYGAIYCPSGVNTWNGPISLSDTAIVFPDGTSTIVLGGSILGTGGLTKIGPGTLTYSGSAANSYSGTTTVNEGTLSLAKSTANNSIVGPLVIGDGNGGANADVVRLQTTSQLGSLVAVTINSSGLFDLNGITETFGSLAGSGNITLGGANINPGGDGTSTLFSGVISETGSFTKSGAGTMTLSGPNSYTGATTVSAGTLLVNGSQPQSPVTVSSSGTLGGTGTVGILIGNGSIAPGASPGALTSSNLTFSATGDFFVELTGPVAGTDYDQLNVHGTNNLGSAILHVNPTFTKPVSLGQQFTIINNDGMDPIAGTFSGLTEAAGFTAGGFGFRVNYAAGSGNDVVLTLTNIPSDFFFTNVLGGDFLVSSNWFPNLVPGVANNANFTSNASYTVSWSAGVTNANAFFNAGSGSVTQSIGAFAWQLTNRYVIGQNAGTLASVTHNSGALRVTNSAGAAVLEVRRGTNRFNSGLMDADRLLLTNTLGSFEFNGGTFNVRATTVTNARTFFVGNGTSAATLNLVGNGAHSFADGLTIRNNGSLTGNGTIIGVLTVQAGATFAPGASVGKIVLSNSPSLAGALIMEISKNGAVLTNDQVQVSGALNYGGTLTLVNIGPDALGVGNRFRLFSATGYAGSFSPLALPALVGGLVWTNKLLFDGSIEVVAAARPQFSTVNLSGTNVIASGTGGPANGTYFVLASTNVALPLTNWTPLLTNQFDGSGNFIFTNASSPGVPQRFYVLQVP